MAATLHFSDRDRNQSILLETAEAPVLWDIELALAWRRHPFRWDHATDYDIRTLRLSLTTPNGSPAKARLHYLGDPLLAEESAACKVVAASFPENLLNGDRAVVKFRPRNTSRRAWEIEDPTALQLRYVIFKDQTPEKIFNRELIALPERVIPGQEVDLRLDIQCPQTHGVYRLDFDLGAVGQEFFSHWRGKPVLSKLMRLRRRR